MSDNYSENNNDYEKTATYRIVNVYKQQIPACRFIGKRYTDSDRIDGNFSSKWSEWFEESRFDVLEKTITEDFRAAFEDCDAYVGLMKCDPNGQSNNFEYWIGMFLPPDTEVPEGYEYIDINHSSRSIGVCWLKGTEYNLYCHESVCCDRLCKEGMSIVDEEDGSRYFFERYACPRFTEKDQYGEVILDIGFFVND